MEQSGSWELSTDVKCFISSVNCLISRRRAAFCLSRSSLSWGDKTTGASLAAGVNGDAGGRWEQGRAVRLQVGL